MTGLIVTTPPTVELPPGNTSGGSAVLPGVTYTYAVLSLPQTWTAKQTFPLGNISIQAADIVGLSSVVPGGSSTQVQYNSSGTFAGISGATTDGTTLTLVAPILGTPASVTLTNASGTAAALTAGNATKLTSPRAIGIGGSTGLTATGVNFDGSAAISPALTGTLAIANGGTGVTTGAVVSVKQQTFTSSATYTPSTGLLYAIIECVGSGGGGGSAQGSLSSIYSGGGGGSGGYSRLIATTAAIGVGQTITIGAAGGGGAAGSNNGTAGGDVSFGTGCIAKGGSGGNFGSAAQAGAGGAGGVAGTGTITAAGNGGFAGFYNGTASAISMPSGNGGSSVLGGAAQGVSTNTVLAGNNAGNYGSGGSGAGSNNSASNAAGGNGSKGIVIVTEFCSQ